jgi:mono/diheme cytochrome c family protein
MSEIKSSHLRNRIGGGVLALVFGLLVLAIVVAMRPTQSSRADPDDSQQVAIGASVYERACASCHGVKLEGQPNWQARLPNGRMPAPPHDASGHTWHHPDSLLFGMTKHGLLPGKYAPPGYESDMPSFAGTLSDEEIWAVLAYIKSSWPPNIRKAQEKVTRDRQSR